MNNALNIMEGVKALLSSPDKWTQNSMARTSDKVPVNSGDPEAQCWCVSGALSKVTGGLNTDWNMGMWIMAKAISPSLPIAVSIPGWNDSHNRTYEDVVAMLDRAIAIEKQKAVS